LLEKLLDVTSIPYSLEHGIEIMHPLISIVIETLPRSDSRTVSVDSQTIRQWWLIFRIKGELTPFLCIFYADIYEGTPILLGRCLCKESVWNLRGSEVHLSKG
jgi:hypothetical protein